MANSDMYFTFDNMISFNQSTVQKCFVDEAGEQLAQKSLKKIYVSVDEESLRARRGLVRQGSNFDQVEVMTIYTKEEFAMRIPMTKRTHYPGTSLGNKIGDVVLDSIESLWSLTCAEKIHLHGRFRVAVGGKTPGEERIDSGSGHSIFII